MLGWFLFAIFFLTVPSFMSLNDSLSGILLSALGAMISFFVDFKFFFHHPCYLDEKQSF